jgi:hypothetical protein
MNIKHFIFVFLSEGEKPSKRMILKCIWCGVDADWNQLANFSVRKCCEKSEDISSFLKFKIFVCSFIILYCYQQIHNYFTYYHTPARFDSTLSSSDSL